MNYADVVNDLKSRRFVRVLVTGPQRSGTTIVAQIVAHELGFQYLDEAAIRVDNFEKLFKLYSNRQRFVLQAPGLAAYCHMMPGAVIFVRRPVEEIINSEQRISRFMGWTSKMELAKYFLEDGIISQIKYDVWDTWQKHKDNMFEIDYHSIESHPFYIADELRKDFKPKQTKH